MGGGKEYKEGKKGKRKDLIGRNDTGRPALNLRVERVTYLEVPNWRLQWLLPDYSFLSSYNNYKSI